MKFLKTIIVLLVLMLPLSASAQFYVTGDDPGRLKWNFIDTESYRVIYPQGSDSLAFTYARKLEKYKIPVSRSSGYVTGEGDGKIMPVVIHAYNDANGSVAWAPKRMDMFAIPSAYDPEPFPWSTMLSVHESRHVSQMQFGLTQKQKPGRWLIGEGWNIVAFLVNPGMPQVEGDAVVTETALTPSGRGRMADFLNYYWVSYDNGENRGWFKWRYMSQKNYSPTFYALGYLTIGGFRYLYDYPLLVSEALHTSAAHPAKIRCVYNVTQKVTGLKREDMWQEISMALYEKWKSDADARAPYIPSERVMAEPAMYTDYTGTLIVGNDLFAIKSGHVDAPTLVRIDSLGTEHRIRNFAYSTSGLRWDGSSGRIYWSENIPDERWSLESGSAVRYINAAGKTETIRKDQLLYNPVTEYGQTAVVRYHPDGHSSLEILDSTEGRTLQSISAADSLQLVETAWLNGKVYMTAISENGYGIYEADLTESAIRTVLNPQPVMIKDFGIHSDELMFACDRTGVHELYHFNPESKKLTQKTSTRYGAYDFQYGEDGYLYYSSQTLKGKHLFRTSVDLLFDRTVRFDSLYRYPIAEKITQQEKELALEQGYSDAVTMDLNDVEISEPKRYRKVSHMFNMHTWFPAYVSVDNIMNNLSFDPLWQSLSLGVSGVMQNHLSTARGEVGYSAHKDAFDPSRWRHSGHFKFTYSGLYPIFQFSLDFNDRSARQFSTYATSDSRMVYKVDSRELDTPYVSGKVSMYIPFNFTSGGWRKGLIPSFSYTITNDIFNSGTILTEIPGMGGPSSFAGYEEGKMKIVQQATASVRGYTMMNTANSQVYPRWGIGAEVGAVSRLDAYDVFSPMGYAYTYGYVPGFTRTQGFKLTAMWQGKLRKESPFSQQTVSILPRGLGGNATLGSHVSLYNENLTKVTADYSIPIYIGDITLGGNLLAIKRLVTYPHFDYTFIGKEGLWSAGLDLTADLHSIVALEWPCSVGVTFSWNGGNAWNSLTNKGITMNRWFIGPIFNASF